MANVQQEDNEIEVVTQLMAYASKKNPNGTYCTLHFNFHPYAVYEYGIGPSWQAVFVNAGIGTTDYGSTIEQAAERLLDRLLHPEKYEDEED